MNRISGTGAVLVLVAALLTAGPAHAGGFDKGAVVEAEWNGFLYLARVLETRPGSFKIHYIGWEDSWDEWADKSRLSPTTGYKVGDEVQVEWKGSYYKAKVLKVKGDMSAPGKMQFFITYPGWDKKWDEWVGVRRIRRLPAVKAPARN